MERIQAAIAKARASRDGVETRDARPQRTQERPARSEPVERSAAWAELPEVRLDPRHLTRNRIVAAEGRGDAAPFDVMRTRTLQQMRPKGWTRLAVTSPDAGVGKTTMTINLAMSLARQPEVSVLLMEMDLRRPSLAKTLGLNVSHSSAEVIGGHADAADNAVRIGENLMVMTCGTPVKNPSDLLQGSGVGRIVDEIETRYTPTIMIFDLPPIMANDDAMAFLGQAHCALLIGAAGQNSIKEVDRAERELASHTEVLGIVLNKCRYISDDEAYGYY